MEQSQTSASIESGMVKETATMKSCQNYLLGYFVYGILLILNIIDLIAP